MSKSIFCAHCGTPLIQNSKALKNKAEVIFTINPHKCDESNLANITDAPKPMHSIDVESKRVKDSVRMPANEVHPSFTFSDKRDAAVLRKHTKPVISTAPISVINRIKQGTPGVPENQFKDIDLDNDISDEEA